MNDKYGWASDWRTEFRCSSCHESLTFYQKMYSHGRCPKCGYKGISAGTIVDVIEVPYRLKFESPRWKFWIKPKIVYGSFDKF